MKKCFRRKRKETFEEVAAGKDVPNTETEGGFVMCEIGSEQLVRVEAPPQKRRTVRRVEPAETHEYVSVQQGLENLVKKKLRSSALFRARLVNRYGHCTCAITNVEKRAFKFFQLAANVTEEGARNEPVQAMMLRPYGGEN